MITIGITLLGVMAVAFALAVIALITVRMFITSARNMRAHYLERK